MILLDTSALVGLVDPRDQHHRRAHKDFLRAVKQPLWVVPPVLAEAYFHLPNPAQRVRLRAWVTGEDAQIVAPVEAAGAYAQVFDWMEDYGEHTPDWADAYLVISAALEPRARVWTYDSEFATIWRRPDRSRIPLL